jgi:acyl-CoA dehydrogenase
VATRDEVEVEVLEPWRAMGMRGTHSHAVALHCEVPVERVVPTPFGEIAGSTLVPLAHIAWAACWSGISGEAIARAQRFVRANALSDEHRHVLARTRLGEVKRRQALLADTVMQAARRYDMRGASGPPTFAGDIADNHLRLNASELAIEVVIASLELVGVAGYRIAGSSPYSLDRQLRDVLSSSVMVRADELRLASGTIALRA